MNALSHINNQASLPVMFSSRAKPLLQAKLTVNTPGDIYEQEADAMADRVMRMSSNEAVKPVTGLIGKSLQRKCAHCAEEEKKKPVMRKAEAGNCGMSVSSSFTYSLNASKGGGSPLPPGTRSFMENAFSADFSRVKIHTGSQASEMSKGISAKAFTYGNDIYFNEGQYAPDSSGGRRLMAHELVHVLQQGNGITPKRIHRFTDEALGGRAEMSAIGACGSSYGNCSGRCRAADNSIGVCTWLGRERGCFCRSNRGAEPPPATQTVPFWVWALGGAAALAIAACFASGVCEAAAIVAAVGEGTAVVVMALLRAAGILVAV